MIRSYVTPSRRILPLSEFKCRFFFRALSNIFRIKPLNANLQIINVGTVHAKCPVHAKLS